MGIFVERVRPQADPVTQAIDEALGEDPEVAKRPGEAQRRAAAAKQKAAGTDDIKWGRIVIGLLIGGALLGVGIYLMILGDQSASEEALNAATIPNYKAAEVGIKGIATSVIALATAWSGGLVGIVFGEVKEK